MKKTAQEKRIELGESLYDDFVESLRDIYEFAEPNSMPKTNTLEKFAVIYKKGDTALLAAEMCREFASDYKDGYFVQNGNLYQQVKTNIKVNL